MNPKNELEIVIDQSEVLSEFNEANAELKVGDKGERVTIGGLDSFEGF